MAYSVKLPDGSSKAFGQCTIADIEAPISRPDGRQFDPVQLAALLHDMRAAEVDTVLGLGAEMAERWAHALGVGSDIPPPSAWSIEVSVDKNRICCT